MKQEPTAETRERILDAAELAFSEHGLAGARVAAIATAADANKAMLYYYFGSKEGLYTAVLERAISSVVSMAEAVLVASSAAPDQRLLAFIEGYRDFLGARPTLVRLMAHEILGGGERLLPLALTRAPVVLGAFWRTVQEGQALGTVNPELDARAVLPALLAPYILFNVGSTIAAGRIPIDPEQLRSTYHNTAMAIARDGVLCSPQKEQA
jgi:AcrR family transcriptional regulator